MASILALVSVLLPGAACEARAPRRAEPGAAERLRADVARAIDSNGSRAVLEGPGGWLFLPAEATLLRAAGFWLDPRKAGTLVREPEAANPLPAILDFHRQLAARGIELLFVPVPSKLAIYPEMLTGAPLLEAPARLDEAADGFRRALEENGVRTLDLASIFLAARQPDPDPLYAALDSHWSPRGCRMAAEAAAAEALELGAGSAPARRFPVREEWVERPGDLVPLAAARANRTERLLLRTVLFDEEFRQRPAAPVLVVGDSHLEVYLSRRSGFRDHFENALGRPVDLIAVQAGGATASRQALARDPGRLTGKRVVVWVISTRLYVSGPGWRAVAIP